MQRSVYLLLEAWAADRDLVRLLPGLAAPIRGMRQQALAMRPPLQAFAEHRRPLENLLRRILATECGESVEGLAIPATATDSLRQAQTLAASLLSADITHRHCAHLLLLDAWTGDLRVPSAPQEVPTLPGAIDITDTLPRSARLERQPKVREARADEDNDQEQGPWMVQSAEPLEKAEDPWDATPGDRNTDIPADDLPTHCPNSTKPDWWSQQAVPKKCC